MEKAIVLTFEEIKLGHTAEFDTEITETTVMEFAKISGDFNPYHIDEKVVHGFLQGALVSRLVGMHLPGRDALLVREELSFKKPIKAPANVHVKGVVAHKTDALRLLEIDVTISCDGQIMTQGKVHAKCR